MQTMLQRQRAGVARSRVQQRAAVRQAVARAATRKQLRTVCMAAAASSGSDDPYKVLGISRDADSNAVNRAYKMKSFDAKNKGDTTLLAKLDTAHSKLMLSALTARMKGQSVAKGVRYADREPLFPWRPKRWDATPKVIMVVGGLQMAMAAYAFQSPNMSKVIGSMLVGIAANVLKQNAISPPPKDASMATEEEQGRSGRNFVRGAILGLLATMAGVLVFSFPELLTKVVHVRLPAALMDPGLGVSLKVLGAALCNWAMTSFYY